MTIISLVFRSKRGRLCTNTRELARVLEILRFVSPEEIEAILATCGDGNANIIFPEKPQEAQL